MSGYIKIGDIPGEAVEPNHDGWINLLSVSQAITRPMAAGASGSTRQRSSATLGDIVCTKELDKSTPKLMEAICKGTNFAEVAIDLCTSSDGSSRIPYMKWVLVNARVTSYDVAGSTDGAMVPTESFALNYEEVKWTYNELDKQNNSKGNVETSWKVEEGEA